MLSWPRGNQLFICSIQIRVGSWCAWMDAKWAKNDPAVTHSHTHFPSKIFENVILCSPHRPSLAGERLRSLKEQGALPCAQSPIHLQQGQATLIHKCSVCSANSSFIPNFHWPSTGSQRIAHGHIKGKDVLSCAEWERTTSKTHKAGDGRIGDRLQKAFGGTIPFSTHHHLHHLNSTSSPVHPRPPTSAKRFQSRSITRSSARASNKASLQNKVPPPTPVPVQSKLGTWQITKEIKSSDGWAGWNSPGLRKSTYKKRVEMLCIMI